DALSVGNGATTDSVPSPGLRSLASRVPVAGVSSAVVMVSGCGSGGVPGPAAAVAGTSRAFTMMRPAVAAPSNRARSGLVENLITGTTTSDDRTRDGPMPPDWSIPRVRQRTGCLYQPKVLATPGQWPRPPATGRARRTQ